MFLNQLNEKEKYAFLDFALLIVNSDGDFSEEERGLVNEYIHEMALDLDLNEYVRTRNLEEIIEYFKTSKQDIIKKVFIEILGLVFVDQHYDEKEKEIIETYMSSFKISNDAYKKVKDAVIKLSETYESISYFILDSN